MNLKRLFILLLVILLATIIVNQLILIYQNSAIIGKTSNLEYENEYFVNDVFYNIIKYSNTNLSECDLLKIKLEDIDRKINQTLNKTTLAYLKVDKFNHLFVQTNECNGKGFSIGFENSTINFEKEDEARIPFFFKQFNLENEITFN